MNKHLQYLSYVLRHKYYVFIGCMKLGVSWWQAIIHDMSKFYPVEWFAYVEYFNGNPPFNNKDQFDRAWNHHQKANPHHWQYWLLLMDDGNLIALDMPDKFVREMVADWYGAGMALGKPDIRGWYEATKHQKTLHPSTRICVEAYLNML